MRNCLDSMSVIVPQKPSVRVCVCPGEVSVVHGQCLVLLPLPGDASVHKGHSWSISSSSLEARKLAAMVLGFC